MTGPSVAGSEKGTPISGRSSPTTPGVEEVQARWPNGFQ
jgi:hypothetical protein